MKIQSHSNEPQIFLIKELLFYDECDRITQNSIPKLKRFNGLQNDSGSYSNFRIMKRYHNSLQLIIRYSEIYNNVRTVVT